MNHKQGGQTNPYAPGTGAQGVFESTDPEASEAKVSFLLTTDDYIAFHSRNYRWGFRKYAWGMIALVLGALWALVLLTPQDTSFHGELHPSLATPIVPYETLIVLTAILVITPLLSPLLIRRQLRDYYENVIRSVTVTVGARGVQVSSDVSDLFYRWPGISRIVTTRDHFFIQINRYQSFIVPRRAFRDGGANNVPAEKLFERVLRKYGPAS